MPIQAWIDESGGEGQGPVFVMAGFVAPAEVWAEFSDEWQACLDEPPRIEYFKMKQAVDRRKQFDRWSEEERDEKVRKLARIASKHVQAPIYFTVDLSGFETLSARLDKPFSEAYYWPFHLIIMNLANNLYHIGLRERFEIFFDEHVIFGPRAKAYYPVTKGNMEPEVQTIMPTEPKFESDKEFLPLQAADMFAWLARRGWVDESHSLISLVRSEWQSIPPPFASHDFSREDMERIATEMDLRLSDPAAAEHHHGERRRRFRDVMGLE